ncbi:hypothetical protein V6N11_062586 [Hibiscus sabdariffa]|uniref:Uncharacterized protein n=1 Tax=Hibiscus sabdariffa TaxID=183260 RepID=A0ABR2PT15_9ROSI
MIGESIGVVETEGGNKEDGVGVNAKRLKLTSDKTGIVCNLGSTSIPNSLEENRSRATSDFGDFGCNA